MIAFIQAMWGRLEKLLSALSRFPITTSIRLIAYDLARFLFVRSVFPSFSQTGEDRILHHFVSRYRSLDQSKFYVDVGCNHYLHYSNSFYFYWKGYKGICIDANPVLIEGHRQVRKRDHQVCAPITRDGRKVQFHLDQESLISAIVESGSGESKGNVVEMQSRRLVDILKEFSSPREYSFLSIDVEGGELEVLQSAGLSEYRPLVIVAEIHGLDIAQSEGNPVVQYLQTQDYKLEAYATMNAYFLDERRLNAN